MSQKISFKLIFEYLSLGWVFLEVIFHEHFFVFYEIFLVSKGSVKKTEKNEFGTFSSDTPLPTLKVMALRSREE